MDHEKIAHLDAQLQAARRKGDTDDVARLEKAIAAERSVPDALPHEKIAALQVDLAAARAWGDGAAEARLSKEITDLGGIPDPVPPRGPDPNATFAIPAPRQPPLSPADTAALKAHGDLLSRVTALEAGQASLNTAIAELRAAKPIP